MRSFKRFITICALAVALPVAASCASDPAQRSAGHQAYEGHDHSAADKLRIETGTNVQSIWQRAAYNLDGR